MQLTEFKAWFEGYTEAMKGPPSVKQWDRIKDRIAEIDGTPITERIFVDRYWPSYYPTWTVPPAYSPPLRYTNFNTTSVGTSSESPVYTSNTAMYALGKAEAAGVTL